MTDTGHVTVYATQITVFYKKAAYINCGLKGLYDRKEKNPEGLFGGSILRNAYPNTNSLKSISLWATRKTSIS